MKHPILALCLAAVTAGCGGVYPQKTQGPALSGAPHAGPARPDAARDEDPADPSLVANAALAYRVLRARGGQEVPLEVFYSELAAADAVCVGEQHVNPHDHWAQLEVLDHLSARRAGAERALGLEMFQRPFQGVLDDYAGQRISAADLYTRAGWEDRWGHDFAMYTPLLDLAVARGMALLALNVSNELRHKVSHQGLSALTAAERARVPELVLDDAEHRAWFDSVMAAAGHAHGQRMPAGQGHGASPHAASDLYLTQVLWDETMADTAAAWLGAAAGRQMVIIAGNGHCHDSAIVRRMQRRGVAKVLSVRPIIDDGDGDLAAEVAQPMADYLFVMSAR